MPAFYQSRSKMAEISRQMNIKGGMALGGNDIEVSYGIDVKNILSPQNL